MFHNIAGDYHLNINMQMSYWAADTAGAQEVMKPLLRFITGMYDSPPIIFRFFHCPVLSCHDMSYSTLACLTMTCIPLIFYSQNSFRLATLFTFVIACYTIVCAFRLESVRCTYSEEHVRCTVRLGGTRIHGQSLGMRYDW